MHEDVDTEAVLPASSEIRYVTLDVDKYFFANRVIQPWNNLPAEKKHFCSLATFKHFLKSVDLSDFVSLGF